MANNYTARCMKCKTDVTVKNPRIEMTKNGRYMVKGECPKCGTTVCRFISKADAEK